MVTYQDEQRVFTVNVAPQVFGQARIDTLTVDTKTATFDVLRGETPVVPEGDAVAVLVSVTNIGAAAGLLWIQVSYNGWMLWFWEEIIEPGRDSGILTIALGGAHPFVMPAASVVVEVRAGHRT